MEKNQVIYYHSASRQDNAEERMETMQGGQNISDNKTSQLSWKSLLPITLTTVFVFVFAKIYGIFSHGVSSAFMSYAFLLPLSLIFLPKLLNLVQGIVFGIFLWKMRMRQGKRSYSSPLWHSSFGRAAWRY